MQEVDLETAGARISEDIIVRYDNDEYRVSSARVVETNLAEVKEDALVWRRVAADGQEAEVPVVRLMSYLRSWHLLGEHQIKIWRRARWFLQCGAFSDNKGLALGTSGGIV